MRMDTGNQTIAVTSWAPAAYWLATLGWKEYAESALVERARG